MAFAAANSSKIAPAFSTGPRKCQILTYTAVDDDVSGTITADKLTRIDHVVIDGGMQLTAAITFSGNVATLAFADPGTGGLFGTILVFGV